MTAPARVQQSAPGMSLVREKVSSILLSDDAKRQIAPLLAPGISLERVVSTIYQVAADNPEILECTPASLILAVARGVKWDLEFGETVHLVPFNVNLAKKDQQPRWEKRAKAIRDYKGDIELVVRSGAARDVQAHCFYANEPFKYEQGTNPYIEHHPIVDPAKRGVQVGAYAWARINVQSLKIVVLHVDEIEAVRKKYSKQWKEGALPYWYGEKTAVHRLTKDIPKNPKLAAVIQEFDKEDREIESDFEVVPENGSAKADAPDIQPPATAPVDDTPALEEEPNLNGMTLEEAKAITLVGPPGSWQGRVGQLLDSFSNSHLEKIRTWLREKIEEKGEDHDKEIMATAITLILEARAKDQTALSFDSNKAADAIEAKPKTKKTGSLPF